MPVEAPAPSELPDSLAQEADFAQWEKELSTPSETVKVNDSGFLESFLNEQPEHDQDGVKIYQMPDQALSLIDEKIPAGARQNGAIVSIIYEIEDLAPQLLGYILTSGRTWFFATSGEAMEVDPEMVAAYFRAFVDEKIAWAS